MIAGLARTANGGWFHPADPGEPGYGDTRQRWSVTPREMDILSALAVGRCVLEIGTGLGVSTHALSKTAVGVITHDIDPWVAKEIAPQLPLNVSFIAERAAIPGPFSMAFIDGLHERDAVAEDIRFALGHLSRPGLIVCHDGRMPHVQAGIEKSGVDTSRAYPLATEAGLIVVVVAEGR